MAETAWPRITRNHEALYSGPRTARLRRRCDGHLTTRHWIESGEQIVQSALPPDTWLGNTRWLHATYCMRCAPIETVPTETKEDER